MIESALVDNIHEELAKDTHLTQFNQKVHASGENKLDGWRSITRRSAHIGVISLSLMKSNASLTDQPFSNQVLSAMRYNFGGA